MMMEEGCKRKIYCRICNFKFGRERALYSWKLNIGHTG